MWMTGTAGGKPALRRPSYMVWLEKCTDVEVDGIVLHDAMCWTLNLQYAPGLPV